MQDANTIPTYEEFHEKYYPYVLRWTIGRVNCKEDGFDIVQDTFLKAFQNYHRVTHADGLLSWILDRKSTRLNSSHTVISYAVFCLKKKKLSTAGSNLS